MGMALGPGLCNFFKRFARSGTNTDKGAKTIRRGIITVVVELLCSAKNKYLKTLSVNQCGFTNYQTLLMIAAKNINKITFSHLFRLPFHILFTM